MQSQLAVTAASISSLGKFKASVSQVQSTARKLGGIKESSTSEEVKKSLSAFVSSFNTIVAETKAITAKGGGTARISRTMTRTMNADLSKISDPRAMGFTTNSDGAVKLDMAKFEAAYKANPNGSQDALAKLGKLVEKTAEKELTSDGRIANSRERLNGQSNALKLQQNAILKTTQFFAQQGTGTGFFGMLLSSYYSNS